MDILVIVFFEFIGGFIRFLFVNAFYRVIDKNKMKRLSYFLYDEKDNNKLSKGYLNAIIGVIAISTLLFIAYFLYNNTPHPPIGGTSLNSSEKIDAFVDFVPGLISGGLTKTGQVVKTTKKGLQGFNQFVKRTPGITTIEGLPVPCRQGFGNSEKTGITTIEGLPAGMKWQQRAGQLFQTNKVSPAPVRIPSCPKHLNIPNHPISASLPAWQMHRRDLY